MEGCFDKKIKMTRPNIQNYLRSQHSTVSCDLKELSRYIKEYRDFQELMFQFWLQNYKEIRPQPMYRV